MSHYIYEVLVVIERYLKAVLEGSQMYDLENGSTINGANVQLYSSNGTNARRWMLRK